MAVGLGVLQCARIDHARREREQPHQQHRHRGAAALALDPEGNEREEKHHQAFVDPEDQRPLDLPVADAKRDERVVDQAVQRSIGEVTMANARSMATSVEAPDSTSG